MENGKVITWKMAGSAGQGQQVAGLILAKTLVKSGLFCFTQSEYPSRLRGGLVTNQVSISDQPIKAAYRTIDLLFALNPAGFNWCKDNLAKNALVLKNDKFVSLDTPALNVFISGLSLFLLRGNLNLMKQVITDEFKEKGKEVIEKNKQSAEQGWNYAKKNLKPIVAFSVRGEESNILLTANDAVSLGAIATDCKFYSSYPMTPSSSILHNLAKWAPEANMTVSHAEDEVAAIHSAIGASWAGVRAMTGTSGGGFALMSEGFNLSGMSETPLVVVECQRPGPATGMATWTEQGDLQFLAKVGHGEFPRIILAPSNPEEAFSYTALAFNLADIYQIPVIVLLDKYISEGSQTVSKFKDVEIKRGKIAKNPKLDKSGLFKRYKITDDGVSYRSLPGQPKGMFLANGNEHNEYGLSIDGFSDKMRRAQMKKRGVKIKNILKDLPKPEIFGPKTAKNILIGWGSTKGPVLEALKQAKNIQYLHIPCPYPLGAQAIMKLMKNKNAVVIENNFSSQLANLLQETLSMPFEKRILKYNGQQFYPEEITEKLKHA